MHSMENILIVGGSRGIGASVLKQNLDRYNCINISRTEPEIDHSRLQTYACDVLTDELPDISELSGLVYCPGSINLKPITSLKEEDFINDFSINVLGAVRVIKKYHKVLKEDEGASIVFFSTVAVSQGMPFHSSVSAAKAGVEGLVRSLAAEFAPKIRVNCIAPSITETPLASAILRSEKSRERISENHPLKRILEAEEVASLASYLISPAGKGITGQVIGIDGGMSTLRT